MAEKTIQTNDWDLIIRPGSPWFSLDLGALWSYRDLVKLFVQRDFVANYKQTILGPLWYVIQPLLSSVVMTVVFSNIAKIPTDNVPPFLFYLSGTVAWNYFASCLTKTSDTFAANAGIFAKVYFPRLVVPVSVVIVHLAQFFLQSALFAGFYVFFWLRGAPIGVDVAALTLLPLYILQMGLLGLGVGILVSSMTTRYRDLTYLIGFGTQLWMYATPIVYPVSQIPVQYRSLYMLNPMAPIVEGFRRATLGVGSLDLWHFLSGWVVTALLLMTGLVVFSRSQRAFIDTI